VRLAAKNKVCNREYPCIVRVALDVGECLSHHRNQEVEQQDVCEHHPHKIDDELQGCFHLAVKRPNFSKRDVEHLAHHRSKVGKLQVVFNRSCLFTGVEEHIHGGGEAKQHDDVDENESRNVGDEHSVRGEH